jgi:hypothetical protein
MHVNDVLNSYVKWNVLVYFHYMNFLTHEVESSEMVYVLKNLEA